MALALFVAIVLLCLPADYFALLWCLYHFVDKDRVVHGTLYAFVTFTAYIAMTGFGRYVVGMAFVFWLVLLLQHKQTLTKVVCTALLALAVLGLRYFASVM